VAIAAVILAGTFAFVGLLGATSGGRGAGHAAAFPPAHAEAGAEPVAGEAYSLPPPPFRGEDIFPCSECHADLVTDPTRRVLEMAHEDIVLHHDEEHRWCLDCHDAKNRDKLRLASGELIDFTESQRLCGQCHGDKYRDWRLGIHGKRTGLWNGKKEYRLCVHCHGAHAPRVEPIEPLPPPMRPEAIR
jgi:hypothetical protein